MRASDWLSPQHLDPKSLQTRYISAAPYPHIILDNFLKEDVIENIRLEFPDLSLLPRKIEFSNQREVKFASEGFEFLSKSALPLVSFLNSDIFLKYLQTLTGIQEYLISDPYLSGGGYHEIKSGGFLKVHADFNKHPHLNLDRRLNLLLYLNKDWASEWGGNLQLFSHDDLSHPQASIEPIFNRCVIFSTTSFTFHGHPQPLKCPDERSRRSLALYYFSTGRPRSEFIGQHGTLFQATKLDTFGYDWSSFITDFTPPIILRNVGKWLKKLKG